MDEEILKRVEERYLTEEDKKLLRDMKLLKILFPPSEVNEDEEDNE